MERGVIVKTVINGMTFDGSATDPMSKAVRDALLGSGEPALRRLVGPRVVDALAGREGREGRDAHVDADGRRRLNIIFQTLLRQWGREYWTCMVFEWLKVDRIVNVRYSDGKKQNVALSKNNLPY